MTGADFFQWWGSQLRAFIPESLRRSWSRGQTAAKLGLSGAGIRVMLPGGDEALEFALPEGKRPRVSIALTDVLADLPQLQRIDLTLEADQFLLRELTLPRAARPHLAEAVGYQLPKLTPFTSDQALYACGTRQEPSGDGPLPVWFVAIPKQRVARALALIGQEPPTVPLRLDSAPQPNEAITVSWQLNSRNDAGPQRLRPAWAGLLAVWLAAVGVHVYQKYEDRAHLADKLSSLRTEAAQVAELRAQLDQSVAQLAWLGDRKANAASMLVVLEELTGLLDDQTWLQRLNFDGQDLALTGNAKSPATLIETLERSATFEGVRFDALTRDQRNDADRFTVKARIATPPPEDRT
jgi:general secretion pathway protein L